MNQEKTYPFPSFSLSLSNCLPASPLFPYILTTSYSVERKGGGDPLKNFLLNWALFIRELFFSEKRGGNTKSLLHGRLCTTHIARHNTTTAETKTRAHTTVSREKKKKERAEKYFFYRSATYTVVSLSLNFLFLLLLSSSVSAFIFPQKRNEKPLRQ